MAQVNYFFEDVKKCPQELPNKLWIKQCFEKEAKSLGCINFIFCSDVYLQKINKKYLNKSYFTDVISFKHNVHDIKNHEKSDVIFGDVFISLERVDDNKSRYKTIFAEELKRVMVHGALHLMGYHDSTETEKAIMTKKENTYINLKQF
ncbi:MAG: rRNA maturation RNase YbeY [Flavobacteriales bacterium]|nr:rRNA maturation RNase YbeY [Flavobacteriales bacterium]